MKKVSFAKMSGAGNDFILFDRKFNPDLKLTPEAIKKLCDRRRAIGADGVLVVDDLKDYSFTLEYYNSDGSTGTLCGNGSRCAIKYAYLSGRLKGGKACFLSGNQVYTGEILDGEKVKFNLGIPGGFKLNFKIKAAGQLLNASFVNTGSPHVVIKIQDILKDPQNPGSFYRDINEVPVVALGREIRYSKDFAPTGTNVNFISYSGDKLFIRTYERGVEDETLACGTGSSASAVISSINDKIDSPVTLITRGGDELVVGFNVQGLHIKDLSLSGPAEVTFTGEFYSDLYF